MSDMTNLDDIVRMYSEWNFMEPADWAQLSDSYTQEHGGELIVLDEGTLLDVELLVPGIDGSEPYILAVPFATTTWTSTYQVRAWVQGSEPQFLSDFYRAAVEEEYGSDEERREVVEQYLSALLAM